PLALQIPSFVPLAEQTAERTAWIDEFSVLAPSVGIDATTAQGLLAVVVDAATALDYGVEHEDSTPEECGAELTRLFGEERARIIATSAQNFVKSRGEHLANFLDESGLGNDVGVLVSLAFAHSRLYQMSPTEAQEALTKLMASPAYAKGGKFNHLTVQALSRI